jgi:hypothetical protein
MRLLADELSMLDASAGDVAPGQASDSALQLRTVVAASLTCDSASPLTLLPERRDARAGEQRARSPPSGDSVWSVPRRASAGCARGDGRGARDLRLRRSDDASGPTFRSCSTRPADVPAGTPVRVTRWERWVVYRARRRPMVRRHPRVQSRDRALRSRRSRLPAVPARGAPVARTGFRYFDASGQRARPDGTNERSIARVRVTALSVVRSTGRTACARTPPMRCCRAPGAP